MKKYWVKGTFGNDVVHTEMMLTPSLVWVRYSRKATEEVAYKLRPRD
jgi:hypothetical protein